MRYLIFAVTALFAAECAMAQSAAQADASKPQAAKESATADAAKQPAAAADTAKPVSPANAAKQVGTKDKTVAVDAYAKQQQRKKASLEKRRARHGDSTSTVAAADEPVGRGSLMTDQERTEHRQKLTSAKTFDECEKYEKEYQARVDARAKEQHKTLRPSNAGACNRYKLAGGSLPSSAAPAAK